MCMVNESVSAFFKLKDVTPMLSKDDFEEGSWYHQAPTTFTKRKDFVVIRKEENHMVVRERGKTNYNRIWYNSPIANVISKPWRLKIRNT